MSRRPLLLLPLLAVATVAAAQKPPPLDAPGQGPSRPQILPPLNIQPPGQQGQGSGRGKPPPLDAGAPPQPGGKGTTGGRPGRGGRELRTASTGTGFVVAEQRVLTNHHVIDGCTRLLLRTAENRNLTATVAGQDSERDLAVLTVQGNPGPVLTFRDNPPLRRGDGVVTYGFPLSGLLSSGPTLTTGEISALAGLRDNQANYQISAPVQQGNSGGPLFDLAGHVVGVVVSKLAAMRIAQQTGDIPQNVNFAVKGTEAIEFLRRNGVQPRLAQSEGADRRASEVGEIAHPSTIFIQCQR
jgi:S1-C subfamily serine protease